MGAVVTYDLGTPPDGYKWIIKDIVATHAAVGAGQPLIGFRLVDSDLVDIFSVNQPFAVAGHTFHYHGTQTIEVGEHIFLIPADTGWAVRVSGYRLSLP